MTKKIKLFEPSITQDEEKAVINVLRSKFWASGAGIGFVEKFENEFKKYVNTKDCVAVNSGTAALHLALSLYDIKGKEVILPSLSFVSTAHAVVYNGGIPIFADVDPKTLCISSEMIEDKINDNTACILPVHFGGIACNLENINKIAKKYSVKIIEDAAHAAGTSFQKKKIGSHSSLVCFSFHPVKNLSMPTGGAICINTVEYKKMKKNLKSKRWCGITNRKGTNYDIKELGWNFYMNEISAVIGLKQLKKLDEMNNIRKSIASRYDKELKVVEKMPFDAECSYHLFWIQCKNRDKIRENLLSAGIETGTHYKPIHKMSYYKTKDKLKNSESISEKIITLPIHANMTEKDVDKVIKYTNKFC